MTRSDEEPPMEAVGGDGVRRSKQPVREDRLHDLKAVGDPIDAADQRLLIHAGLGRGRKAEHNLWLDTGFGQALQRNLERIAGEVADRAIVDIAPDWRIDAIFGPDGPVGETDLAADGTLAPRFSLRADRCRHVVSISKSKVGKDFGEGVELPTGPKDLEHFLGDVLKVHVPRRLPYIDADSSPGSNVGRVPRTLPPKPLGLKAVGRVREHAGESAVRPVRR